MTLVKARILSDEIARHTGYYSNCLTSIIYQFGCFKDTEQRYCTQIIIHSWTWVQNSSSKILVHPAPQTATVHLACHWWTQEEWTTYSAHRHPYRGSTGWQIKVMTRGCVWLHDFRTHRQPSPVRQTVQWSPIARAGPSTLSRCQEIKRAIRQSSQLCFTALSPLLHVNSSDSSISWYN